MRAWDLAIFIILLEMSIGFLSVLGDSPQNHGGGLFTKANYTVKYFSGAEGGYITTYQGSNASTAVGELPKVDPLSFAMDWIFFSFNMLIRIVEAFAAISIVLYRQFHLDPQLCMFIQGIVYLIYTWAFIQWRSGRGGRAFE